MQSRTRSVGPQGVLRRAAQGGAAGAARERVEAGSQGGPGDGDAARAAHELRAARRSADGRLQEAALGPRAREQGTAVTQACQHGADSCVGDDVSMQQARGEEGRVQGRRDSSGGCSGGRGSRESSPSVRCRRVICRGKGASRMNGASPSR